MVQPVEHDIGSAAGTTVLGAVRGGLFYGILGTVAATAVGALLGAGVVAAAGALLDATILPGSWSAVTGFFTGIGGLAGAIGGFVYGGATSVAGGAIAGAFQGKNQVDREQGLANAIQYEKAQGQTQVIAQARGDAIEQGTVIGYQQGMQDGQAMLINQITAAQQQHEQQECKVAKKIINEHHAKHGAGPASHVEKAMNSKAEDGQHLAV